MTLPVKFVPVGTVDELNKRHKLVCADQLYSFLRFDCRDILGLLQDGQISCGKAAEAIVERKLGYKPVLPPDKVEVSE